MNKEINVPRLEHRMYALVHRSLSPIQKGIQSAHAFVEYQRDIRFENDTVKDNYDKWGAYDKTMVLLDGGTHDDLMSHYDKLRGEFGIYASYFREPDLNGCITAVSFLLDERIYDDKKYPDSLPPVEPMRGSMQIVSAVYHHFDFDAFLQSIGGEKNYELRKFVKSFRLAI